MLINFMVNRVVTGVVVLAGIFFGLLAAVEPVTLIIVLNGIFAGSMVAIAVAYHRLILGAALGIGEYTRVRQMTIGFALTWVVICMTVSSSIYARFLGTTSPALELVAGTRYLAIVAAVLQVTAPDFGLGLFHGRDRLVLWTSAVLGLITAILTIYIQDNTLFF